MNQIQQFGDVLLSWHSFLISFGVFVIVGLMRTMGISFGYAQNIWFQRFMPLYPYLLAFGLCIMPKMPLPDIVNTSLSAKLIYGLYLGWLSGFSYQMIKSLFKKAGMALPEQP